MTPKLRKLCKSLDIRHEYYGINVTIVNPLCRGPEKTVSAVARIRGSRQRFKPNLTRASGRKEHENNSENDKMSQPESKEETEKVLIV